MSWGIDALRIPATAYAQTGQAKHFAVHGMKVLDFRKDGVLTIADWKEGKAEFNYILVNTTIDIFFPANPKNVLRLRICELTSDKLTIAISGRRGEEKDDKFSQEWAEFYYVPTLER